jgi:predicted nucleotidyltransferase
MSNSFKINLNSLRQEGMKEVLDAVETSCKDLNIDFYIIGAIARDIWFSKEGRTSRATKDIDFAVYISQEEQYAALKENLIKVHGFNESKGNSFVLFSPKGIQIDLLPFGAIEVENGVQIKEQGLSNIKVTGFKEVYEEATDYIKLETEHEFKIATLPGIVLLKFIAYDDRPEHRESDMLDIAKIIQYFFELESDMIYENHNDLFEGDVKLEKIAARVIGREMSKALLKNKDLLERITSILNNAVQKDNSSLVLLMTEKTKYTIEEGKNLLNEILLGIEERIRVR